MAFTVTSVPERLALIPTAPLAPAWRVTAPEAMTEFARVMLPLAAVSVSEKALPVELALMVAELESVMNTLPDVLALRLPALVRILAPTVPMVPEPEKRTRLPVEAMLVAAV